MIKRYFLVSVSLAMLLSSLGSIKTVHAISGLDWQAGRIMDDGIFADKSSMSVDQIQAFLNQKVGTGLNGRVAGQCDTYGTAVSELGGGTRAQYGASHNNPAPFTCLKDYYEVPKTQPGPSLPASNYGGAAIPAGAESAAQLIWDAAQRYSISPKVLLVTIHKESAGPLTTDDWPFKSQYTYAMGAHCPDSGPNGSANCDPNYAGFSIQISESAALLRYYLDNMNQPWWPYKHPGNNSIQYNPNTGCGSSVVNILTMSTAALYTYTPYQPNQAALNNLYGTGDSCSAYGNRNFWRIYNDWFGSTRYVFGNIPSAYSNYARAKCSIAYYDPVFVGRLYNPDTQDYIYTPSQTEACNAVAVGYIWDGIVFKSALSTDAQATPVYRVSNNRIHLFLTDKTERDNYINNFGFRDEGITLYIYATQQPNTIPAYKLSNGSTTIITSAGAEGSYFQNRYNFTSSGVAFYTLNSNVTPTPVYRLRKGLDRFYTTDAVESDNLQSSSVGYVKETNTGMEDFRPDTHNLPVYRLSGPSGHFYTIDRTERDTAIVNYGYYAEGAGWYAPDRTFPNSYSIYRDTNINTNTRLYTSSIAERDGARTYYGYSDEGVGWYSYPLQ